MKGEDLLSRRRKDDLFPSMSFRRRQKKVFSPAWMLRACYAAAIQLLEVVNHCLPGMLQQFLQSVLEEGLARQVEAAVAVAVQLASSFSGVVAGTNLRRWCQGHRLIVSSGLGGACCVLAGEIFREFHGGCCVREPGCLDGDCSKRGFGEGDLQKVVIRAPYGSCDGTWRLW